MGYTLRNRNDPSSALPFTSKGRSYNSLPLIDKGVNKRKSLLYFIHLLYIVIINVFI